MTRWSLASPCSSAPPTPPAAPARRRAPPASGCYGTLSSPRAGMPHPGCSWSQRPSWRLSQVVDWFVCLFACLFVCLFVCVPQLDPTPFMATGSGSWFACLFVSLFVCLLALHSWSQGPPRQLSQVVGFLVSVPQSKPSGSPSSW